MYPIKSYLFGPTDEIKLVLHLSIRGVLWSR